MNERLAVSVLVLCSLKQRADPSVMNPGFVCQNVSAGNKWCFLFRIPYIQIENQSPIRSNNNHNERLQLKAYSHSKIVHKQKRRLKNW